MVLLHWEQASWAASGEHDGRRWPTRICRPWDRYTRPMRCFTGAWCDEAFGPEFVTGLP